MMGRVGVSHSQNAFLRDYYLNQLQKCTKSRVLRDYYFSRGSAWLWLTPTPPGWKRPTDNNGKLRTGGMVSPDQNSPRRRRPHK